MKLKEAVWLAMFTLCVMGVALGLNVLIGALT